MDDSKYIIIRNVKIFDRKVFPYTILNTDVELVSLIRQEKCPVLYNDKVIGYVCHPVIKEEKIYGDVIVKKEYPNLSVNMQELSIRVDNVYSTSCYVHKITYHCKEGEKN